ncbi:PepSY domain-containing protein [Ureibacillus aquaedulcis]|uniref:PepSY domain-containing protein n=1 Tax=Ureibacillus aquaedulcis TaxID=3058421 RepID=A0ABT8GU20_9BACL|nr:PepSY domain-containing protein [Ureibacillus sp. BA0131]MDN4494912.1 PepSY domain-containing protein [Ureibacillus sp. BA0131]
MGIGGIIAVSGENIVGSADTSKVLTKSEIEKKALAEVKGKITEIDFDTEGSRKVYEVEVLTAETEYDLKFDAVTGELLRKTKDDHYDDDRNANTNTSTNNSINTNTSTNNSINTNGTTQAPSTNQQNQDDNYDDRYDDDHDDDDDDDSYDDDRYDDDDDDDRYDD